MKPKKYLGQNFLTRDHYPKLMVEAAAITKKDTVLEIGPGKGILTKILLEKAGKVIAVEKDRELVQNLKNIFLEEIKNKKLILKEGDALNVSPKGKYKIVANIPYYITGEILRYFLSLKNQPKSMTIMVQKEVAERIIARSGKQSLLSISVKVYGKPKIISRVSAGNFYPKPNVDSAILHVENISKDFFVPLKKRKTTRPSSTLDISSVEGKIEIGDVKECEERFFKMLHLGFAHKRKVVIKNLESLGKEKIANIFEKLEISKNIRAEDIDISLWKKIAKEIKYLTREK